MELSHFDKKGNARMVDVGAKDVTERIAVASGSIKMKQETFSLIRDGKVSKGDVLTVATTAGAMAAKKTSDLIPMCHIVPLSHLGIDWKFNEDSFSITCVCTAKCKDRTGVEMEALTGASVALLTVYDMCKAVDREMEIESVKLLEKDGGKSGHFIRV